MKVALVHDWLITFRGGEKVLDALCELFPQAELFTLFHQTGAMTPLIEQRRIHASFLDRVPLARRRHRHFLPLMPLAIEALKLEGFDLIVSSSHCVAKGVRKAASARHLSYVHAPMRYVWDRFPDYFGRGRSTWPLRTAAHAVRPFLQRWDRRSAQGVDRFVANSHHIAQNIARLYGRQASVVHPPVELERFSRLPLDGGGRGGYFLWLGALAPYKRVDLAMDAFASLGLPLWIAGSGQEQPRLRRRLPWNVTLLGQVADRELPSLYFNARALVFTGEEDFGLTPLEAQACGRPVIAFGRGGALETVTAHTGCFFAQQTIASLVQAVREFEAREDGFRPDLARANAARFSRAQFLARLQREVDALTGATTPDQVSAA